MERAEWESFIDGTVTPNQRVHQQLHMWVNRDSRRTLMLATRYYSSDGCASTPDNNNQRVVIVENLQQNVEDIISKLKLKCPAKELRSNSALHPDARVSAAPCKGPSARAGERGR
jgi:hypothetical protein